MEHANGHERWIKISTRTRGWNTRERILTIVAILLDLHNKPIEL